ncbi:O-antigen ligase family protein [Patescibacteria group bacterium]|nr:O-antigen ligase family protein [Patescibacteria group bacterium]
MNFFPTGNFNEYASFFIYLGDLLLLFACFFYGLAILRGETKKEFSFGSWQITVALLAFAATMLLSVFFAEYWQVALLQFLRFVLLLLLYFLLINDLLERKEVLRFFLYGLLAQSLIAFGQYIFQGSLGLRFLGEPILSSDLPGVAKIDFAGMKLVRAYGTFPHPNVFGGILVAGIFWLYYLYRKNLHLLGTIGVILLMALLFTFSRSAFLALGGGLLVLFSLHEGKIRWKYLLLFGCVALFLIVLFNLEGVLIQRVFLGDDPKSALERLEYITAGKKMFFEHPFGVGMGNFTLIMQNYLGVKLSPWLLQPVHNVYMLMSNEAGFLGVTALLVLLGVTFFRLLKASRSGDEDERIFTAVSITILLILALISLFDHYLLTLYGGQVFFVIYLALVSASLNKSLLPRRKS